MIELVVALGIVVNFAGSRRERPRWRFSASADGS